LQYCDVPRAVAIYETDMVERMSRTGSTRPAARSKLSHCPVTFALEGGGAYGRFEWGVLERLLDARELRIEAVSGATAGAMNAVMLAQGVAIGGPDQV
jgi:predicted acylesterase/phospholipase RssA